MEHARRTVAISIMWFSFAAVILAAASTPQARRIEELFLTPCCWSESVAVHRSELAGQMRAEIGQMLRDGKTREEIIEIYVKRHGERVLREPRGTKFTILSLVPWVVISAATVALLLYLRRMYALGKQEAKFSES